MARMSKLALGKISLARGNHSSPDIFIPFARPASLSCEEDVCTYTYLTVYRLCMKYRCCQIILQVKDVYTHQKPCDVITGYASLGRRPYGSWCE